MIRAPRRGKLVAAACAIALVLGMTPASAAPPVTAQPADALRVGASRISITPDASVFPFAPSRQVSLNTGPGEKSFVGVHDDIFARALVFDDGVRRVALVAIETTAVPDADAMTRAVAKAIGIAPAQVMLVATHTHSVPLFSYSGHDPSASERREIARIRDGAVAAARAANAALAPAHIVFARGSGWINVNNGEQAGLRTGFDPSGPSDKSLDVLRFVTPGGKPIAMLVDYASHAEVMFRSVTRDDGYEVTGDLPGAVSRMLEALPEGAPIVAFTPAAEADQLTLFKSLQAGGALPPKDEGAAGWSLLDVLARRLAQSVLETLAASPPPVAVSRIDAQAGEVVCPGRRIQSDGRTAGAPGAAAPAVAIPLGAIELDEAGGGRIALAGIGGDVASEIGRHVKAASPATFTTVLGMAGRSAGYIFADASYVHPGHGLSKSLLAPQCAEPAIVAKLGDMIGAAR